MKIDAGAYFKEEMTADDVDERPWRFLAMLHRRCGLGL